MNHSIANNSLLSADYNHSAVKEATMGEIALKQIQLKTVHETSDRKRVHLFFIESSSNLN